MEIIKTGASYIVRDGEVEIKFSNLSTSKDEIIGFVRIFVVIPTRKTLSTSRLNLLSPRSISELANRLNKIYEYNWDVMLQASCTKIIEDLLNPPEPIQIKLVEKTSPIFLIDNFILEQAPTLWFAPGGSGKSFLALALAVCAQNGFDLFGTIKNTNTLYLDWETDEMETNRRATMLANGLQEIYNVEKEKILLPKYLRMYFPLIESTDYLLDIIFNHEIKFIIIDSVAPALGSDLISAAEVTKFFSSIRKLNAVGVTTLLITHVSKGDKKETGKKTPFGSVFFENFPRLTWELKSEYEEEQKKFTFGIFCRKSNVGKLDSKGFALEFTDGKVSITTIDSEELENDEKKTLGNMIIALLEKEPMTPREMASTLQTTPSSIWVTLSKLKKKNLVTNVENGKWTLESESPF